MQEKYDSYFFKDPKFLENISENNYYALLGRNFFFFSRGKIRHLTTLTFIYLSLLSWHNAAKGEDSRSSGNRNANPRREEPRTAGDFAATMRRVTRCIGACICILCTHSGAAPHWPPALLSLSQTNGALLDNWLHADVTKRMSHRRIFAVWWRFRKRDDRHCWFIIYRADYYYYYSAKLRAKWDFDRSHGKATACPRRDDSGGAIRQDFTRDFFRNACPRTRNRESGIKLELKGLTKCRIKWTLKTDKHNRRVKFVKLR